MNAPKDSAPNPLSPRTFLANLLVTVVGGLILWKLTYILQDRNLATNEESSIPTVTSTLLLTNTPILPSSTTPLINALAPPANTPTVSISSSTPVAPASCQVEDTFGSVSREYTAQLGCNQGSVQTGPITIEAFQNGYLVWIASEEDLLCDAARAYGYPAMGFGKLWCTDATVNSSLGAPLDREQSDDNAQRQIFEKGQIFQAYQGKTFVLVNNGNSWIAK